MNGRELFLDTLAGRPVPEPFLWESGIWEGAVQRWRREALDADADPYAALGLRRVAGFGIDFAPDPPFAERVVADTPEYLLIETEAGSRCRRSKTLRVPGNWQEAVEEPLRFPIRDRASWRFYRRRLDPDSPRRAEAHRAFLEARHRDPIPHSGMSGSFAPSAGCPTVLSVMMPTYWLVRHAGFERTAMLLYDDLDLVREIYAVFAEFLAVQLERILAGRVPDAVILNEDSAASHHGPFMAPALYQELATPGLARLAGLAREAGAPFAFVNCGGDVTSLAGSWRTAGVNGIMPLDAPTDTAALARNEPDLALIGGIDRTSLERDTDTLEAAVGEQAGFLFAHGRSIPSGDAHFPITERVSYANMQAYVRARRRAWEASRSPRS